MKYLISDVDPLDSGNSVLLTLINGEEVIVGNKVVNKLLRKFRLNSGSMAMSCSQRAWLLDTTKDGTLVEHAIGDTYNDKDGNPVGEYTSAGYHVEFSKEAKSKMPVIRMAEVSRDVAEFVNSLSGKFEPIGNDVAEVAQHIPGIAAQVDSDD